MQLEPFADGHSEEEPAGDGWFDADFPPIPNALDRVVELSAVMSMNAAQLLERVEAMRADWLEDALPHGQELSGVAERSLRLELASALGHTEAAADRLISHAEAMVRRYPKVLDALAGARTTPRRAEILVEGLDTVEPELRAKILPRALALAESLPDGSFRRQLRNLLESVRVTTLAERHAHALEGRRVAVEAVEDGMAWLHAYLPAVEAHAVHGRLTATAKALASGNPDDTRTLDQLRADVFGDILIDGVTDVLPVEVRGIRATVAVTVPVLALMAGEGDGRGEGIAHVEGIGPVPLARARELCGTATNWMRVLTHPETGMVLSVGRDQYRPPPELRRLVRWRSETCMAPGCNVPASRCEIDHNVAWEHGGTTGLNNLLPFCKGHHLVKHHGGWCVRQLDGTGGTVQWRSPSGRVYRVEPTRRVPVFTP